MHLKSLHFAALLLLLTGVPVASAQAAPTVAVHPAGSLGSILTDRAGLTLYLYSNDAPGVSNCYDECAANWPPLLTKDQPMLPSGIPGAVGQTPRTDGTSQVTYNGMPLYYWVKDKKPGDTTGQNVGGVWFVVNPGQAPSVSVRTDADLGDILVDARGMTLYLFTKDETGVSHCYDDCATAWPPLLSDAAPSGPDAVTAGLDTITRDDGGQQVTYNGQPLYYWFKDAQPGDTTGQNVGGVWFTVNP